jgi:hypothetical protein
VSFLFLLFAFSFVYTFHVSGSALLLIAPVPSSVQTILGTICKDTMGSHNDTSVWIYSRGKKPCETLDHSEILKDSFRMANKLVFVFQMPLPREGKVLDYSRWQQNLIGILQTDIAYDPKVYSAPNSEITLGMRYDKEKVLEEISLTFLSIIIVSSQICDSLTATKKTPKTNGSIMRAH